MSANESIPLHRKAIKRTKQGVKDILLSVRLPQLYREAAKDPVDAAKVVFVEGKLTEMPDAYTLLWDWLEQRYDLDLRYITLRQNSVGFKTYVANCEKLVRELATAKYVFLNDASDVVSCLPMRPETKVVQLWHACGAFKKWGMSTADLEFGGTREQIERHPFYRNLDIVTVSSPEVEWAYREAMVLEQTPEVVRPLGVSRTDIFYDDAFHVRAREAVEDAIPECVGKKVVLYAPTFRGHVRTATGPDQLDIAALKEALGEEYVLLVKHHPFVKKPPAIPRGCETFAFQVGGILPIDQLLSVADVCVTDYSSIVFEYSLLDRPIAFFTPDLEEYNDWRGFYYDFDELTPGPVFKDNAPLIDWIAHASERFDFSEIRAFRERFMSACDGHATERIAAATFADALEPYSKRTVAGALAQRNPDGKDLSIIIPAYNAESSLGRALESVLAQTYARERIEVIVVDDCSTDSTWQIAQRYSAAHPDTIAAVQTTRQSGSPSEPRNIGLARARGEYVFFLDADDWLAEKAVDKMLAHALDWNSDVLAVKMRGHGGRKLPTSMFDGDYPSVDIYESKLMWTFAPLKLFRRSLVEDLRFPDFMPEDISFVLRAFVGAEVVSIASDYDYYHVGYDLDENTHISLSSWSDVETNLRAYDDLFTFISENIPEDKQDQTLLRRLMRRDILRTFMTIGRTGGEQGLAWYRQLVELTRPFYRPGNYLTAPPEKRVVLEAAYVWGYDALCSLVRQIDMGEESGSYDFLSCEVANRALVCSALLETGRYSFSAERGLRSHAQVRSIDCSDDGWVSMSGTVQASAAFALDSWRFNATIVARHSKTGEVKRWPCELTWSQASIEADDDYPAKGTWEAAVNVYAAETGLLIDRKQRRSREERWHLYLTLSSEGFAKETRLVYPGVSGAYVRSLTSLDRKGHPKGKCMLAVMEESRLSLVDRLSI